MAVLCGTSNYLQILSDDSGNRRIIPVFVDDIDKEKFNEIDKKELFMEMYRVYKEGFDWRIGPNDLKLLNKDEETYTVVVKEKELIMKFFEPGTEEYLSTTEMIVEIEKMTQQKINTNVFGRFLEPLGFVRKSVRVGAFKAHVRSLWGVKKVGRPDPMTGTIPQQELYKPKPEEPEEEAPF